MYDITPVLLLTFFFEHETGHYWHGMDNAEEHELTVAGMIIIKKNEERSCGTGSGRMEHAQGRDHGMVQSTRAVVWLRVWADRNTVGPEQPVWGTLEEREKRREGGGLWCT